MKKIIHLSDLHVGYEDCGTNFRTIIDNIVFLKQPAENYIVVITGDIVDNANKSIQIDEAVASIQLLEKLGYKVLAVPGNHDYGTGTRGDVKFVDLFKTFVRALPCTAFNGRENISWRLGYSAML